MKFNRTCTGMTRLDERVIPRFVLLASEGIFVSFPRQMLEMNSEFPLVVIQQHVEQAIISSQVIPSCPACKLIR